jgi:hypothetical protein
MTAADWAGLIVSVVTIILSFGASIRWLVKHYLEELKPNGGASMRDSVNTNTERLNRVEQRVDQIYILLCEKDSK